MIGRPVVLVLGAGASAEYGFPTGQELMVRMLNYLDPALQGTMKVDYLAALNGAGFPLKRIITFRNALAEARVGSVDAFIAKQTRFRRVGRAAVAASLIPYEDEGSLRRPPNKPLWFELLFRVMTQTRDPFEDNELSVITFNYDRSFEHMMFVALCNLYPGGLRGGRKRLKSVPIVHVHGTLGGYPPLNNGRGRPYDPTLNESIVKKAEKAIKIIPDDEDNDGPLEHDEDFEQAYELLYEAELIVLLGFGFHSLNVNRLALGEYTNPNARILATSKGFTEAAMQGFRENAGIRARFEHFDLTCTELLLRYGDLLAD